MVVDALELAVRLATMSSDIVDTITDEPSSIVGLAPSQATESIPAPSPMPPPPLAVTPRRPSQPRVAAQTSSGPPGAESEEFDSRQARILKAQGLGHHLVFRPTYVFCRRCASHARCKLTNLVKEGCKPARARTAKGRLTRLWEGRHHTSGAPMLSCHSHGANPSS